MLVSVYLPFSDFRPLIDDAFRRLVRPQWPAPRDDRLHVRGIGSVQERRKMGFEGWVGEDHLAVGLRSFALRLPYVDPVAGLGRLRLIRKAFYFDGLINGRFEFLFSTERCAPEQKAAERAALALVDTAVRIKSRGKSPTFDGRLSAAGPHSAHLWAEASVAHGADPLVKGVKARRALCVVESDSHIEGVGARRRGRAKPTSVPGGNGALQPAAVMDVATLGNGPRVDCLILTPSRSNADVAGSGSHARYMLRYLRTYTLRLLQNIESLSVLFAQSEMNFETDRAQNVMNEYTRRIFRSRQRLNDFVAQDLIDLSYASFETLYPGRTDGLSAQLQNSHIRPSIVKKMLDLIEECRAANYAVTRRYEGDFIMGDKYGDVNVQGSQGVAVGRGASAAVEGSVNEAAQTLSDELLELAKVIRTRGGGPDSDVEATLVESAAAKAAAGDEDGAAGLLKKSADWVLGLAKASGTAVLTAFLKARLGI